MKRILTGLFAVLVLAACETPVQVQTFPDITFAHAPKIGLNVAAIEIVNEVTQPVNAPKAPAKAIEQWARDRLVAKGASGTARFVVTDGALAHQPMKVEQGLKGAFKVQQSDRYSASVAAVLEIYDAGGFRRGSADASAERSITTGEDATMNDRDQALFDLVEGTAKDFDSRMEGAIRRYIGGFVM